MGSFGDLLLSIFMSKKARSNLKAAIGPTPSKGGKTRGGKVLTDREKNIQAMQSGAKDLVNDDRAELIRKAMEIRQAKQAIFADLNEDQKQRLVAVALKKLMRGEEK
ncbi:MAG: hypothetical protein HQL37_05295 [Alphaproteobacteria bacterium]|nr:hypothetical protein [Alphaproteobacteria bacterium]